MDEDEEGQEIANKCGDDKEEDEESDPVPQYQVAASTLLFVFIHLPGTLLFTLLNSL